MILKKFFGPSTLIAAAFIGPGTLTTCTMAGVKSGYTLIWVMVFAIIATIILQEMAARLGFYTRSGLGEILNQTFKKGFQRYLVIFLVIGSILVGNAAYEAGNLSGAVLGLDLIAGNNKLWPIVVAVAGFLILFIGKYQWLEKLLVGLVILMSICFGITAFMVSPDLKEIFSGFIPGHFSGNYLLIMGLIGTTIVPYNLFLHASTISKKWTSKDSIKDIRIENSVSIILGGIISILIIITAAASSQFIDEVNSAKDLAIQLEPIFGSNAKIIMGIGLLAAGLSSALTAPLAAAYAAKGIFNWKHDEQSMKFRMVWMIILLIGFAVIMTGVKPVLIIKFAQIMNAFLLPLIAGYLVFLCNKSELLAGAKNSMTQNILAIIVLVITVSLSTISLLKLTAVL